MVERLELEFKDELKKQQIDELDKYHEQKRWQRQKEKALLREFNGKRQELKERTQKLIEDMVEETSQKLKADYEHSKMQRVKAEKHERLEELRVEYEWKMNIINEIKRDKELRTGEEKAIKEAQYRNEMRDKKLNANSYKQEKLAKERQDRENMLRSKQQEQIDLIEEIKRNKPKVVTRQQIELGKIESKKETLHQRAIAGQLQKEKLDAAVEAYAFRPKVEADEQRLIKETEARQIRKETVLDKADAVDLFKNHGYTIDKLMKDIRFKVNACLTEAGLAGTNYGKEVIRGLQQPVQYGNRAALQNNTKGLI